MPILPIEPEHPDGSPFYQKHQQMARNWEKIAADLSGESEGRYNAYLVEAKLKIPFEAGTLIIQGSRQQGSVTTNVIPLDSSYSEQTRFIFELPEMPTNDVLLKRKSLFLSIQMFFNQDIEICSFDKRHVVKTKDKILLDRIIRGHSGSETLFASELKKFQVQQNPACIKLEFYEFLHQAAEIKQLIDFMRHTLSLVNEA